MPIYTCSPIANMREKPELSSRVISQAFFGEELRIVEEQDPFVAVVTSDGYLGWIGQDAIVRTEEPYEPNGATRRLQAHVYRVPDTEYGPLLTLPYDSKLQIVEEIDARWLKVSLCDRRVAFIQKGDLESKPLDLISFSQSFLGLPYTWGGRSSFGFDCSGYTQMLYKQLGIQLERDARQQIRDSRFCTTQEGQLGDLVFWGFSEGEIKHVGMCLDSSRFIHTSVRENRPYLRISHLEDAEWKGGQGAFYPYRVLRHFQS